MKHLFLLLFVSILCSCGQDKTALKGETEWQKEQNATFKDASTSPLKSKDLKVFNGLDFFAFDSTYVVEAKLKLTPDSEWFNMKTTTERLSRERIYAVATFQLKGKTHQLNIYQGEDNLNSEKYRKLLFLPFLDDTNGNSSYGGGRYINLSIPQGDSIIIDFNEAYNPLCVYNEKYSCPIVPRENYLETEVRAGMKDFKKS